jgi:hypothetical protein
MVLTARCFAPLCFGSSPSRLSLRLYLYLALAGYLRPLHILDMLNLKNNILIRKKIQISEKSSSTSAVAILLLLL